MLGGGGVVAWRGVLLEELGEHGVELVIVAGQENLLASGEFTVGRLHIGRQGDEHLARQRWMHQLDR